MQILSCVYYYDVDCCVYYSLLFDWPWLIVNVNHCSTRRSRKFSRSYRRVGDIGGSSVGAKWCFIIEDDLL